LTSSVFPFALPASSFALPFASPVISDALPLASPVSSEALPLASPVVPGTADLIAFAAFSVHERSVMIQIMVGDSDRELKG
jgi:hypothetical protein